MTHLDKLKELTELLPEVPTLNTLVDINNDNEPYITYMVEEGTSIGLNLLNKPEVSVQDLLVTKGTSFPSHKHTLEKEYAVIYSGKIEVTINDKTRILGVGDYIHLEPNVAHSGVAIEDTRMIAIGVPSIEGYPIN